MLTELNVSEKEPLLYYTTYTCLLNIFYICKKYLWYFISYSQNIHGPSEDLKTLNEIQKRLNWFLPIFRFYYLGLPEKRSSSGQPSKTYRDNVYTLNKLSQDVYLAYIRCHCTFSSVSCPQEDFRNKTEISAKKIPVLFNFVLIFYNYINFKLSI